MQQSYRWMSISTFLAFSLLLGQSYWQQDVHTKMNIELRHPAQELHSNSEIVYINQSPDELNEIYMHLYPNAFQIGSVKYREYLGGQGSPWRAKMFKNGLKGYESKIDVSHFQITSNGNDILDTMTIDDTILKATLSSPLSPGDSLTIYIDWVHHVGKMAERAGYVDGQYNMAQWYPKMVVYDENGWHNDPFHASGEFYGEFGSFDVTLNVPSSYIVGATGTIVSGDPGWESVKVDTSIDYNVWLDIFEENQPEIDSTKRREVRFVADDVHDFAWVASEEFLYESGEVLGTDIHVLYNASRGEEWTKKVLAKSIQSVVWLSEKFGSYPYPQITVTDRLRSGGMEYPMLVMNGSDRESLIVHEIGHIWFYGIIGNNEVDEAWLDEGFTTFQTAWYMQHYYEGGNDISNQSDWMKKYGKMTDQLDKVHWSMIRYITSGNDEPISRSSYRFKAGNGYRYNAYIKPAQMHRELMYLLGEETYLAGMQTYYDQWKLKHTNEQRFREIMSKSSGKELDWFFDPWLHDTRILDYGVESFNKSKNSNGGWDIELVIKQNGNRFMPLDIETILENGESHSQRWENHLWRYSDTLKYNVSSKPINVIVDPEISLLDIDRRNNASSSIPTEWMIDIQEAKYQPIDAYVGKWMPSIQFNEQDEWIAGLYLDKSYNLYEKTTGFVGFGTGSSKVYGSIEGWRRPTHLPSHTSIGGRISFLPGINEFQSYLKWTISPKNFIPFYQNMTLGFRITDAIDQTRTHMFDEGKVGLIMGQYDFSLGANSFQFTAESTPGYISDWTFSRISLNARGGYSKGKIGFRSRFIGGKIWSEVGGVPSQERFTVESAGAGDYFNKSYLRDESSLFGHSELRSQYHVAGDGNLRGFMNSDIPLSGVEALVAQSIELFYKKSIDWPFEFGVELATFFDSGLVWGSKYEAGDEGFEGDFLADAGIGIRIKNKWLGKTFYFRVDIPVMTYMDESMNFDPNKWIFSFQKGI